MSLEMLPVDISNIIENYKYQMEHREKLEKTNKEFIEKKYYCNCCEIEKHENIIPILFKCNACKQNICDDCENCIFDDTNEICNTCFLIFNIFSVSEEIIRRKITQEEEIQIIDEIIGYDTNLIDELDDILHTINEYHQEDEEIPYTFLELLTEISSIILSLQNQDDETDESSDEFDE